MTPWVLRLLVANVGVFFLQMRVDLSALAFVPAYVFVRPWTLITYMFLHAGTGHIFFNMLALFFFGMRVESRLGPNRFITLYLLSGIVGALLSFFFAPRTAIIGASGGTFGVMLAFAYFWPGERILIWGIMPVEARVLVVFTTLFALFSGVTGSRGGVADFAHLGGYAGAWLYLRWLERSAGIDKFRRKATPKIAQESLANWRNLDPATVHEANRPEITRLLDKIKQSGLGSLTPHERAFLSSFMPADSVTGSTPEKT